MLSISFLATALVVVLLPGTGVLYTVSCGLLGGRRAALAAAFGCTLGIVPHLAASVLGLAALLHVGGMAYQAIRVAGALYLGYLAWSMWRNADAPVSGLPAVGAGGRVVRAIAINLLNPKLTVFFFAFLPQFVAADAGADATRQMVILGLAFMAMTFVVFVGYGVCASAARQRILAAPQVLRWFKRGFAAVFAALGVRLAVAD